MNEIKIFNKDWTDNVTLYYENNYLYRNSFDKDGGSFVLNDHLLIIKWDRWGEEYFYSKDYFNYYQILNNNYHQLNISQVFIINENEKCFYLIDLSLKKIYLKDNLSFYGNIDIIDNYLIINNSMNNSNKENVYIYFNFAYYEKKYFESIFEKITIHNTDYFLERNTNVCYENYSTIKIGSYRKYKNKIQININNVIINYLNDVTITRNNRKEDIMTEMMKDNTIYIINDKENLSEIINIIEFYKNFDFNVIIFDKIENININDIYYDLNIIHYDNLKFVLHKLKSMKEGIIYINTESNVKTKFNLIDNKYFNLFDLDYITPDILEDRWIKLNNNNYDFLLSENTSSIIPKIIHFIWIGNNKIPSEYINYIKSWIKNHPDYKFYFWNDSNIPKLINQKYYDEAKFPAQKADILRYELLYFFGGIYVDSDFLCIKNIDKLIYKNNIDGFSAYESKEYIAIGILGFKNYDNILFNIIKRIPYNINNNINNNSNKTIPELTGPIFFTEMWNKYKKNTHCAFQQKYFYSYTFSDKFIKNKKYFIENDNYAIHMWGYSWKDKNDDDPDDTVNNEDYHVSSLYLSNLIDIFQENRKEKTINKINYKELTLFLKNQISFIPLTHSKKRIVNIMGLFFTGGIERYLYYIDKYGNHQLYDYYLLYISNGKYVYQMNHIKMISFDWDHEILNKLIKYINPDIIIDHYSQYLSENYTIYKNINRSKILYFIHSAIVYNNDISNLLIDNCIHLYKEDNKDKSWNNIINNYYVTLGTEIGDIISSDNNNIDKKFNDNNCINNNKIHISIIGRIAEEKLPIEFFKKLSLLSNEISEDIEIHIYGEKDKVFNKKYVIEFDEIFNNSKIILHNFIEPSKIKDIYLKTDILLIPSIYETGSFTCIEAFSYGIPVIARNVYGLKNLIKNNINGYLLDNDDQILNKIMNIKYDKILKNRDIIIEESLKYNIIDKIKDLEFIINERMNNKNIVIITSVLNCINKQLSYYHTRSVFTIEERYLHTIKSIESIKKFIPDVEILFCECSDLSNHIDFEKNIKKEVDYYYNFYNIEIIKNNVNSMLKGLGETYILLEGIDRLMNFNKSYKNIFKLSGRYYLNENFNYRIFDNHKNVFTNWDNSNESYCTIFYKIYGDNLHCLKSALLNSFHDLNDNHSLESCMYKYFKGDISLKSKLNISGLLATEGYKFSV